MASFTEKLALRTLEFKGSSNAGRKSIVFTDAIQPAVSDSIKPNRPSRKESLIRARRHLLIIVAFAGSKWPELQAVPAESD